MADDQYLLDLNQRLRDYGNDVERSVLPGLKADITNLKTTFEGLIALLKKKGLLASDPYQFAEKISEIQPVPNDPFLESQRLTVLSIRMHHFDSQLAYLSEYFQFSVDALTLPRIKAMTQLLRYVRWESLSENHQETNTKIVAEIVGRIRKGEDSISTGICNDLTNQLAQLTGRCFEALKRVTLLKREEYKALLRTSFWESMNLAPEEVGGNPDNVQRKIKKEFATHLKGQPYIQELVRELLDEDFAPNGAALKDEVLHKLQVKKAVTEKPKTQNDPRLELMEACRSLASYNIPLETGLRKLIDNAALLDVSQDSLGDRFRRWIRSLMGIKNKPRVFMIDVMDQGTGATKQERLEFDPFVTECQTRARVLAAMANRNGPQFQSLLQRGEDEILVWFERQFIDAAKTVERMNGLDLFFKTEVPKERRNQVKGVKAEVSQIRTHMSNANKQRHEAVARREEQEQLRRLGVRS